MFKAKIKYYSSDLNAYKSIDTDINNLTKLLQDIYNNTRKNVNWSYGSPPNLIKSPFSIEEMGSGLKKIKLSDGFVSQYIHNIYKTIVPINNEYSFSKSRISLLSDKSKSSKLTLMKSAISLRNFLRSIDIFPNDILSFSYNISDESTTASLTIKFNPSHLDISPGAEIVIYDSRSEIPIFTGYISSIKVRKAIVNDKLEITTELNLSSWEHIYIRTILHYIWQLGFFNIESTLMWDLLGYSNTSSIDNAYVSVAELSARLFLIIPALQIQFIYSISTPEDINIWTDSFCYNEEKIALSVLRNPTINVNSLINVYNSYVKTPNMELYFYPTRDIYIGKKTWFYDDRTSNFFKKIIIPDEALIYEINSTKSIDKNNAITIVLPMNLEFNQPSEAILAMGGLPVSFYSVYNMVRSGFTYQEFNSQAIVKTEENNGETIHQPNTLEFIKDRSLHLQQNLVKLIDTFDTNITIKTDYFIKTGIKTGDWVEYSLLPQKKFIGRVKSITIDYNVSSGKLETKTNLELTNCISSLTNFNSINYKKMNELIKII